MTSPNTESDKSIDELLVNLRQGRDFYKTYPEVPLDYEVRTAKDQLFALLMDGAIEVWDKKLIEKATMSHEPAVAFKAIPVAKLNKLFNKE